jgi:hypothetical protein
MNVLRICLRAQVLLAALATAALAQPEQWLEYHTGTETHGYRWLDISTNPPADVPLPKLQPGASFGQWKNGMEAGKGRWFCLDRTSKGGPCDRLFFDSNGNGRLDDESPATVYRRDSYSIYFDPLKVVFKGEEGMVSYHLNLRSLQYDDSKARLLASSGGWYDGKVKFGAKTYPVQLVDNTVNGTFNDSSTEAGNTDRIIIGDKKPLDRYLGRYVEVDGKLFSLEVARDGAFVKVKEATGVEFGDVQVPGTISEFTAIGENGHFVRKLTDGKFSLPTGKYRVHGWSVDRKDDAGKPWQLAGYGFGKAADFAVAAGNPTELTVGEPVRAALQATESKGTVQFSLSFVGLLGETVTIERNGERPRAPQINVASAKGDYQSTSTFEYG